MLRTFTNVFLGIVVLLATTSVSAGLDEGLVFYLTFDNVKNQTIIDESGNGLDAEIFENTEIVEGQIWRGNPYHRSKGGLRQYRFSGKTKSYR